MERRKQYSFDVQAAEAFGVVFRGLPWDPAEVVKAYNVSGSVVPDGIPVYVFELIDGKKRSVRFKLVRTFIDDTSLTYTDSESLDNSQLNHEKIHKIAEQERRRAFVGYDVETQAVPKADFAEEDSAHLLSHQFYIAHDGKRIGFIILTERRFTEKAFTKLIAEVVPPHIRKAYIVAHYSLIEGGWMLEDTMSKSEFSLLFESAHYPKLQAAIDAELDVVRKIINSVFDEANTSGKRKLGVSDEFKDIQLQLNTLQLSSQAKEALLSFKTRDKAFKAVCGGYARYHISETTRVPAIRISRQLRNRLRKEMSEAVIIQKRGRTWQGTASQMSKSKRDGLVRRIKAAKEAWRSQVDRDELIGFYNNALLSVLERNHVSKLRDDEAGEQTWRRVAGLDENGKRPKVKGKVKEELYDRYRPLVMEFCDMMHFSTDEGKSLKAFGKMIGIPKLDLEEGTISDMKQFLADDLDTFCRYGVRDSIVTAEALAFYGRLFLSEIDAPFSTRITAYSRKVFRRVLIGDDEMKTGVYGEKIAEATAKRKRLQAKQKRDGGERVYRLPEENLKHYLGFERFKKPDGTTYWWPGFDMQSFTDFYYGGWNDCRVVGSWGPCTYWDLKSAYPSAIMMLRYDYDFSTSIEYTGSEAHKQALRLLQEKNPFQIAGVELSFEFKDGVEPIFPVRFDAQRIPNLSLFEFSEQLIYPRCGHTYIGWAEFSVAMEYGLLQNFQILRFVTYPRLREGSVFADEIEYLLRMRGELDKKMLYKELLNFLYGQTAMGVARQITIDHRGVSETKTKPGGLTCIPIAAYCTSFCRAAMGELLALGNPAYAITTDGFISPTMKDLNVDGILLSETDKHLRGLKSVSTGEPLGYEFIEPDFVADTSLFLKTRGYVLVGEKDGKEAVKMAKMGVQTKSGVPSENASYDPRVREFLSHLINGEYPKLSWQGFKILKKKIKGTQRSMDKPPIPITRMSTLNHTYDFKRMLAGPISESTFSYGGVTITHPKFQTAPLSTDTAFKRWRTESARRGMKNVGVQSYLAMLSALE